MTPAQIQRLRRSFSVMLPVADATAARFFQRLFIAAPDLRARLPAELATQRAKFVQMLGGAVGLIDKPHVLMPMARQLGARQAELGVRRVHYPVIGAVLLSTLEDAIGPAFDDDTRAAWETLYALLLGMMLDGATAVAA